MNSVHEQARAFLYRHARPLDMARYQFHFAGASGETVAEALAAYQNRDGGFGHALEADCWNPHSSPIQTWAATEILKEIGWTDQTHPIVQGTLDYLTHCPDFDGHFYANVVESNNAYPHAPWWHSQSESACHTDYNPTACLAGFLMRFGENGSPAEQLGRRLAREVCAAYLKGALLADMHSAACVIRLLEYAREAGKTDALDCAALEARLQAQVKHSITADRAAWETGYICRPSQFFNSRQSIFYPANRELAEYECEFIQRTQLPSGAWPIPWSWGDYPAEWAISKTWWQGTIAVNHLIYLRNFGLI